MTPILTFVGKSYAHRGFRFYHEGIPSECPKECQLYPTCQERLPPKMVYEVVEVMNRVLACPKDFHEEELVLVKVEAPKMELSMENRSIFEGSFTSYAAIDCDNQGCANYEYCHPSDLVLKPSEKVKIIKKIAPVKDCAKNKALTIVKVEKKSD